MPVFNDSDNIRPLLKEGDYIAKVVDFEIGISTGTKTNGREKYIVGFEIENHGNRIEENLIDHSSCAWKIDTFLKSSGVKLTKGQSFSFRKDEAEREKITWIDPLGLRCHVKVIIEEYTKKNGEKGQSNRIAVFYTDKPALPREKQPEPEDDAF